MSARSSKRARVLSAAVCLLAAVALSAGLLVWNSAAFHEWRLSRMDLLALDRLTASSPSDGVAWYFLGMRMEEKGIPSEAASAFLEATKLRPNDAKAKAGLGRMLLAAGDVEAAFNMLKTAVAAHPSAPEPHLALGRLYRQRGAYHKAEAEYAVAVKSAPNDANAWMLLAFCHLQMQQVKPATEAIERSLALDPRSVETLRLAGSIAAATGDFKAARDHFEKAVELHPEEPRAHHDLANFLLSQSPTADNVARAERALSELEKLSPEYPLLSWHRGRIAKARKEWQKAVEEFTHTIQVEPGLDEAYFHLAEAHYRLGNRREGDRASTTYRQRSELTRRIEEARIRLAISDDPALYFELAGLQRKAGLLAQARQSVEEGLRLSPRSPVGLAEKKALDRLQAGGTSG